MCVSACVRACVCMCLRVYMRVYARVRIRTVQLHTIMFRHPTDDQLLICLLFQQHHSSVYAV